VRTVRESVHSPVVQVMREAGYPVEPSVSNPDTTVVISCPVTGPDMRSERDVSIWEKALLAAHCQRWWSDNSVSVTVTFDPKREGDQIPAVIRAVEGQVKSLSFLPMAEGVYAQAPYQRVSRKEWESMESGIKAVNWDVLYGELPDAEGEKYCNNDVCEIP